MREHWARTLALLTGSLVVLLSVGFSLAQNAGSADSSSSAAEMPIAAIASVVDPAVGRQVYDDQDCARCHSIDGEGSPRSPLDGVGSRLPADELRHWVVGDASVADDLSPRALSTKQAYASLPPEQLDALIGYLQSLQ